MKKEANIRGKAHSTPNNVIVESQTVTGCDHSEAVFRGFSSNKQRLKVNISCTFIHMKFAVASAQSSLI